MKSTWEMLWARGAKILGRIARAARDSPLALDDEPLFLYTDTKKTIFISVFDIDLDDLVIIMDKCSKRHGKSKRLVFLTNNPDFAFLRNSNQLFEYFPGADTIARFGGDRDWPTYYKDRLDLLSTKWRPEWRIDYGTRFEDFVENLEIDVQKHSAG